MHQFEMSATWQSECGFVDETFKNNFQQLINIKWRMSYILIKLKNELEFLSGLFVAAFFFAYQ